MKQLFSAPLVLCLLSLACSSAPVASVTAACNAYYDTVTTRGQRCFAKPDLDFDTKAGFLRQCQRNLSLPGVKADATWLQGCVDAFRASANTCAVTDALRAACKEPPGALQGGAACTDATQCASDRCTKLRSPVDGSEASCGICNEALKIGATCTENADPSSPVCRADLVCNNGKCSALPARVAEGGDCSNATRTDLCEPGLFCDVQFGNPQRAVCKRFSASGESCGAEGKRCQPDLLCIDAVCKPRVAVGGECKDQNECPDGIICNPATKKCDSVAAVTRSKEGAACAPGCELGLHCVSTPEAQAGICKALLAEGMACEAVSSSSTVRCAQPFNCLGGKCTFEVIECR
jgi:hypothetical protein